MLQLQILVGNNRKKLTTVCDLLQASAGHEKPERNSYQESRPSKTNWGEKNSFLLPEDRDTGSL
jgi:hypothetical protein